MNKVIQFIKDYCGTLILVGGFLAFYCYGTTHGIIRSFLMPTPAEIHASFARHHREMFEGMLYSFRLLFPGLALSTLIALLIGIPMGLHKGIRSNVHPIVYALGVIPIVLIPPFAINIFASFQAATIFLVVFGATWGTLFGTITGIQTVNKGYLDNAAALEINGLERLLRVTLPAAMPTILAGFVTSLRSSFLVLIYAEMFGSKNGMGRFIQYNTMVSEYTNVVTGTIFLAVVLVLVMLFFEKLKDRALRWTISSE